MTANAGRQQIEYSICLWTWTFGQNPDQCGCYIENPRLSLVSTSIALPSSMSARFQSMDGYQRCADSRIFAPCSSSCICNHVPIAPKMLNLHLTKKLSNVLSIHARVSPCQRFSLMVTSQSIHCVRFQISWQLTGKGYR